MKTKWTNLQKKYKVLIVAALVVVLVGGSTAGVYAYGNHQEVLAKQAHEQAVTALSAEFDTQSAELDKLQKSAAELLVDSYLKGDITDEDIKTLETAFASVKDIDIDDTYKTDLQKQLDTISAKRLEIDEQLKEIRTKFDTQTAVNALFSAPALSGNKTAENLVIADTVDSKKIEELKSKYSHNENPDEWQKSINAILEQAKNQTKQADTVKVEVEKYLKDGKLTADITPEIIVNLKAEVGKLKNEKLKTKWSDEAVKIENLQNEKVKAAAEKQAAEVGGTAEKQEDGTYKVVTPSNTGAETKPSQAAPSAPTAPTSNNSTPSAPAPAPQPEYVEPAPEPEPEPEPVYEEPYIVQGQIIDGLFDTAEELGDYAYGYMATEDFENRGLSGFWCRWVVYSNATTKYTVEWY
ncbi:hypothetical protein [Scatolibacter rhodanostii]|uniref:hypothetical protein n=1 Tax=Scatolibacter rhodanostii TaxID=2014781 RepID=UPI000C088436|nr:hypothetical protein [Scatolibacter rhodanostii]